MSAFGWQLKISLLVAAASVAALIAGTAGAQGLPATDINQAITTPGPLPDSSGSIASVGPGDTLAISIMGPGGANANVTVDADGKIVVPFVGTMQAAGKTPAAIGQQIADALRTRGYLEHAQVAVEVLAVRSRVVSILGSVARPGRYALTNHLSLLELLALAGGSTADAGNTAVLIRRVDDKQERIPLYLDNSQHPSRDIQDTDLKANDIVFVPKVQKFYVYGEVGKPGAYPVEDRLNVMRAIAIAGGLTPRSSDRRIQLEHMDEATGKLGSEQANLTDPVRPGDVVRVGERIF
ncbi:SLBB domain-containing protein [Cupriavidus sp. USMAA2-4]|uniref:SLBB domain-containing protein n=1 Tax=Cupriavidus sp. USMAA2-4 TaxID=876364 RepID=UPI0018DEC705|nr:polysaccharide biosynthesis/export family protein [Cupriavidus sp. USMAA2-4]